MAQGFSPGGRGGVSPGQQPDGPTCSSSGTGAPAGCSSASAMRLA
jgi:hypothetical protein